MIKDIINNDKDMIIQLFEKNGSDVQLKKLLEEMRELKAEVKYLMRHKIYRKNILTEVADVTITLSELIVLLTSYGFTVKDIEDEISYKIKRTKIREGLK